MAVKSSRKKPEAESPAVPDDMAMGATATARAPLKKRELIELVAARSGVKKADAKLVVEASLAVLGEALAGGQDLIVPPLGKVKISREKTGPNGRQLMLKLALPDASGGKPEANGAEGLAEDDDSI